MGSGKTSIANMLAEKTGMPFIEMDDLIVQISERESVNDIFEQDGEIRFRELEIKTAKIVAQKHNTIISTGGGVVMNKIIIDYLKQNGTVIFLDASFEIIEQRLAGDTTRPLFKNKDQAKKLYDFRRSLYEHYADITIQTDNKTLEKITEAILPLIRGLKHMTKTKMPVQVS